MSERPTLNQKYEFTAKTLQSVVETLSRIDERLAIFIINVKDLDEKLAHHLEVCPVRCSFPTVLSRISVLESKNGHELRESIKELRTEIAVIDNDFRQELKEINERVQDLVMNNEKNDFINDAQKNKWKTFSWVLLNLLVPAISVIISSVILYYMFKIQNNIPTPVQP